MGERFGGGGGRDLGRRAEGRFLGDLLEGSDENFFFQAEDGIRDYKVTGVQTCALPISAGMQWRNVKIEGSVFTGREPDEERYDFDRPRFDSYSGRISWNPTPDLAFQVSHEIGRASCRERV